MLINYSGFNDHIILKSENGEIKRFGSNKHGECGMEDPNEIPFENPKSLKIENKLVSICLGKHHSFYLVKNNQERTELYGSGNNEFGQLGLGSLVKGKNEKTFKKIQIDGVKDVFASYDFTILLTHEKENNVFFAGKAMKIENPKFYKLKFGREQVQTVACGYDHSLFKTECQVFVMGSNQYGQLGKNKEVEYLKEAEPLELKIEGKVVGISCGFGHSIILINDSSSDKQLLCFGKNGEGQLGLSHFNDAFQINTIDLFPNIKSVHCGALHTVILLDNGYAFSTGLNDKGQLGIKSKEEKVNLFNKINSKNIISVATGSSHTIIYNNNKEVFIYGNSEDDSFSSENNDKYSPKKLSGKHSLIDYPSLIQPKIDLRIFEETEKIKEKINNLKDFIGQDLIGKENEINIGLLSLIAQEHVLFVGVPGVAKSFLARKLCKIVKKNDKESATYFEKVLTRFSLPEELFGPYSISQLKNDIFERKVEGTLIKSEIAFIDEIFKANSAILNSLLDIMNERKYMNGTTNMKVDLLMMIGASNELPDLEELGALFDRFLFKYQVKPLPPLTKEQKQDPEKHIPQFTKMLEQRLKPTSNNDIKENEEFITIDELLSFKIQADNDNITFNTYALIVIKKLKSIFNPDNDELDTSNIPYVSDRTWCKATDLLKIMAYTNGRKEIELSDLMILQHICWRKIEEIKLINKKIGEAIKDCGILQNTQVREITRNNGTKVKISKKDETIENANNNLWLSEQQKKEFLSFFGSNKN